MFSAVEQFSENFPLNRAGRDGSTKYYDHLQGHVYSKAKCRVLSRHRNHKTVMVG